MKVMFVGAGNVASAVVNLLRNERGVSQVICVDKDLRRAREFVNHRNGKVILKRGDASKVGELARLAKGVDVIVNSSLPDFNLKVMSAALKAGANYLDLDSRLADLRHAEQLSLNRRFEAEGLVGLVNAGISPGLTNLAAAECADRLDAVESIKIRLLEELKARRFVFSWNPRVTVRELSSPALIFSSGRYRVVRSFSAPEKYQFPRPIGQRLVYTICGDEVATLPLFLDVMDVDYKCGGTEVENARALFQLGLFRRDKIKVDGAKVSPFRVFCALVEDPPSPRRILDMIRKGVIEDGLLSIAVEASGTKRREKMIIRKDIIAPPLREITKKQPGATYISYPTGAATAAFLLAMPLIKQKGVFPPEALPPEVRRKVLRRAVRYGLTIRTSCRKKAASPKF